MDKSKNNYKYIIAVSSFILMAVAFSIVNSVNTILTAPVINARNFITGLTEDELEKLYTVPFFIWTNYDTPEETVDITTYIVLL